MQPSGASPTNVMMKMRSLKQHHEWTYQGNKTNIAGSFQVVRQYQLQQTGLLACGPWFENLFFRTNLTDDGRPNIQIIASDGSKGDETYFMTIFTQYPLQSRTITLNAESPTNPLANPVVGGVNRTQLDVDIIVQAIQMVRQLVQYEPLNSSLGVETSPGPTPVGWNETDFLRSWVRNASTAFGGGHYVGSTSMGNDTNSMAVLDPHFRVRGGITNLRVCDLGSLPWLLNGNSHADALMVGERCSEFILSGQ